jgi:hypothetical protein
MMGITMRNDYDRDYARDYDGDYDYRDVSFSSCGHNLHNDRTKIFQAPA